MDHDRGDGFAPWVYRLLVWLNWAFVIGVPILGAAAVIRGLI